MRKVSLLVLGLGLVASIAPLSAQADHCNSNVVIFNRPVSVNSGAVVCLGSPDTDEVDGRVIYPGSTAITVRYIIGCAAGDTIGGTLSGSLLNTAITLTCSLSATGAASFNSPEVALPAGGQGCVTATINDPEADGTNVTTYRTVGATC